jgi:hypothetical protein
MVRKGFLIAAGVLCFVLAAYIVFRMFSGPKEYGPELPPARMRLAERLVPNALGDMRGKLPKTYFNAVLLQFEGHRNALDVRKMVEDEIVRKKILFLMDLEDVAEEAEDSEGWLEKAKGYAQKLIGESMGVKPVSPDEKIKEAAKKAKMNGWLWGKVDFEEESGDEERGNPSSTWSTTGSRWARWAWDGSSSSGSSLPSASRSSPSSSRPKR